MKRTITILGFLTLLCRLMGQVEVGKWQMHLPYVDVRSITSSPDKIFAATRFSLFEYNPEENYVKKISKTDGLNDSEISCIKWLKNSNCLFIAYSNGNIDLYKNNNTNNIRDLLNTSIIGSKRINSVHEIDGKVLLATDFGIIWFDPDRKEFRETWYIGNNAQSVKVNSIVQYNGYLFAATATGVIYAKADNQNLIDFNTWKQIQSTKNKNILASEIIDKQLYFLVQSSPQSVSLNKFDNFDLSEITLPAFKEFKSICTLNNSYAIVEGSKIYEYSFSHQLIRKIDNYNIDWLWVNASVVVPDNNGNLLIGDSNYGLVWESNNGFKHVYPNGPENHMSFNMVFQDNKLYVTRGGHELSSQNNYNLAQFYTYSNNQWGTVTNWDLRDMTCIAPHPKNKEKVFIGTWGYGVLEYDYNKLTKVHNSNNSSLQTNSVGPEYVRIPGMGFDFNDNLWVGNTSVAKPLSVFTPEGEWHSFSVKGVENRNFYKFMVSSWGQKWFLLTGGYGIVVFDDNETPLNEADDKTRQFEIYDSKGKLISSAPTSIAEDNEGAIWIGTQKGIAIYSNPRSIITSDNISATQPIIEQDGIPGYLLETETVTAIAVDGANRKWCGTDKSGVYLISANGDKLIHHFNTANSPLPSDNITSVAIDPTSGVVYFGTSAGIASYRSNATQGNISFNKVYAFPNPVKPEFTGVVTITGLMDNTVVKITDSEGLLVTEGESLGGQFIWDLTNTKGNKVKSGVYIALCVTSDGKNSTTTKILVINQ